MGAPRERDTANPQSRGDDSAPRDEILRVLREVLAPLVRADGGEIYLVSLDDEGVKIHLGGRYAGCPGNNLMRRQIIEPAIRAVAPKAQVSVTAGALVPSGAKPVGA